MAMKNEGPCMNDALDLDSLNIYLLCQVLKETDLRSVVLEADYPNRPMPQ